MNAKQLIPVLNVSNIVESFEWFKKLGFQKAWDWGEPPTFGAVCSGECTIFLCENGQGGRGKGTNEKTFGADGNESEDQGVWLCIMIENVDEVHQRCLDQGLEITFPPTDEPWGLREMHVRHPDGHVFRIGHELEHEHDPDHPHDHDHRHDHDHPHTH